MADTSHQADPEAWRRFCSYDGVVTAVVPFGAYIEIAEGIVGLLPDRERAASLSVGDRIAVQILQLDSERRREAVQHFRATTRQP